MKVVWTETALRGFEEIVEYLSRDFSQNKVSQFLRETKNCELLIASHPNSGSIEWLNESNTAITYRFYMVGGLSKMLYFIQNETIYIADFWDVRTRC